MINPLPKGLWLLTLHSTASEGWPRPPPSPSRVTLFTKTDPNVSSPSPTKRGLPRSRWRPLVNRDGGPAINGRWRRGLARQSRAPLPMEPSLARASNPPARRTPGPRYTGPRPWPRETDGRTPSARPTAAAGARRSPNCSPGPTNAGRGGEVRAAGGACEPLGGRRGEAAREECKG